MKVEVFGRLGEIDPSCRAIRSCWYGCLGKHLANLGQTKGFVKLSIDKHTAVGGDLGTIKFQLQTAVEIDPQREMTAFTRWVTRSTSILMCILL